MSDAYSTFVLKIDGITPAQMRLDALALYMVDFAKLLGADQSPHFDHITTSSTSIGVRVPQNRELDATNRIFLLRNGEGPVEGRQAQQSLSLRLARDRAQAAAVIGPSARVRA